MNPIGKVWSQVKAHLRRAEAGDEGLGRRSLCEAASGGSQAKSPSCHHSAGAAGLIALRTSESNCSALKGLNSTAARPSWLARTMQWFGS